MASTWRRALPSRRGWRRISRRRRGHSAACHRSAGSRRAAARSCVLEPPAQPAALAAVAIAATAWHTATAGSPPQHGQIEHAPVADLRGRWTSTIAANSTNFLRRRRRATADPAQPRHCRADAGRRRVSRDPAHRRQRLEAAALGTTAKISSRTSQRACAFRASRRAASSRRSRRADRGRGQGARHAARRALSRILLFVNPAIGHSVERVHALATLYDEMTVQAAEGMVAIWQALRKRARATAARAAAAWRTTKRRAPAPAAAPARAPAAAPRHRYPPRRVLSRTPPRCFQPATMSRKFRPARSSTSTIQTSGSNLISRAR